VGFKVTPMLWKFITKNKENSLSAGRCQTPALKIIHDNQKEINETNEKKVYNTTGYFTNSNIVFELNEQYETEDDMISFLDGSADFSHIYTCSQPIKIFKKQPEPFTTSKLQQVASNELHYSPKETMRICQLLYEGGFITYMRTDSKIYSTDFIDSTKKYIIKNYDAKYINENINTMNTGVGFVKDIPKKKQPKTDKPPPQEAHEAIRPTDISLFELPEGLDNKEKRMYKLIWENTLESCMEVASFYSVTATIQAFRNTIFVYSSELIDFPGWKIVKKKYSTDNKEYQYLQTIRQNSLIPYKKISSKVTLKGLKQHYTEARLIQLLEEKGIGRPSTFSSLVDKIQERGYVKKEDIKGRELSCTDFELENGEMFEIENKREFGNEKGKLIIQSLGIIVIDFLDKNFAGLFNYEYTKLMEDELDKIAKGDLLWFDLCETCNNQIDLLIDGLKDETKIEIKIDENNTYIVGKYGPVVKFTEIIDGKEAIKFKPIKKDIDIHKIENGEYTIEDIVDNVETTKTTKSQYILGQHQGNDVVLKKGKFGMYISWGENSKNLKELGNRPIENITFEEVKKYLDDGNKNIREINSNMSIRKGPKGDYIFYKTSKMKKPKFFDLKNFNSDIKEDYKICDITILKSWISEKYDI
jgi:DNA topoisomerase-1